jgi:arginine decarboxylase
VAGGGERYNARPSDRRLSARRQTDPETRMTGWNLDRARRTYSIAHWGEGYFDIDTAGRIEVRPRGAEGPAIALPEAVDRALAEGMKLPLLLRFSDILGDRLGKLQAAFAHAMDRVRLWRRLHRDLSDQGQPAPRRRRRAGGAGNGEGFGLEAGSKPELMAVLALARPGSVVVCNGYKDREYIRLALIGASSVSRPTS